VGGLSESLVASRTSLVGQTFTYSVCIFDIYIIIDHPGVRSALHHVLRKKGYDPELLDPWYFPSPASYSRLLEAAGFHVVEITLAPRFSPLNGPLIDWVRLFCRNSWLTGMDDEEAEQIMKEVQDVCKPDCMDEDGNWAVMYTRLRFKAILPA
jgi:hypothetical protein